MRYLIAGGAGFLGAAVCKRLLDDGDEVIVYDAAPGNVLRFALGERIADEITVRGDVTDGLHLLRTAKERRADVIVHLPSLLGPAANANPGQAVRVNCGGMVNALETARILGLRRVVWASSSSVYRGYRHGDRLANDTPYRPVNIYGGTKVLDEMLAEHYTRALGVDTIGIRFILMVGPGKQHRVGNLAARAAARPAPDASPTVTLWRGLTTELIDKPVQGLPGRVPYGDDVASWLWVDDGARALILAARADRTSARVFNIGGDVRPIREAVEVARTLIPDAEIELAPGRHGLEYELDTSAIEAELGFRIGWTMEDQIRALVDLARAEQAEPASFEPRRC